VYIVCSLSVALPDLANKDVHNAVFYDHMRSSMGRNVQLCCEHFSVSLADATKSFSP